MIKLTMSEILPFPLIAQLMSDRQRLSMRDMLQQLALVHFQVQAKGFELALEGHYRKAFHALQKQPRRLQQRARGVACFYLVALYAEQLLEPDDTSIYFATAYRELYGMIDQIHERYEAMTWRDVDVYREIVAFFDAVTLMTPLDQQRRASQFYRRPFLLAPAMTDWIEDYPLRPLKLPLKRREWFPRPRASTS